MDGVLIIDKPVGPTSHDVVARVRRAIGERRIGHTGTLDPAASGVLPLVVGRATRLARFLSAGDKRYEAVIRFGFSTDTGDAQGIAIGAPSRHGPPSREAIDEALDTFRGTFLQQPPAFSAKKIDGTRSHKLARARVRAAQARATDRLDLPDPPALPAPVSVTAHAINILSLDGDAVAVRVHCSAGFYVRALAHDLGERLGSGAHLVGLRRTQSGDFTLRDAVALDVVEGDPEGARARIVPLAGMLLGLSSVVLTAEGARRACHGRDLAAGDLASGLPATLQSPATQPPAAQATGTEPPETQPPATEPPVTQQWVRLLDQDGSLVGIARRDISPGVLHPSVVLV